MKKILLHYSPIITLIAIVTCILIPGWKGRVWIADDIEYHVFRQASFSESIKQGNLIPRWGGNLAYGYGSPTLMFHYPLVYYVGHIFHIFGGDYVNSVKLAAGFFYLIGMVAMYRLILEVKKEKIVAFVGTLIFALLPYRIVLLYFRAALGEHAAVSWAPVVFLCGYLLLHHRTWKRVALFACSLAASILLHQAVSLMTIGLLIIFLGLIFVKEIKKSERTETFLTLIFGFFLGIGLAAFFWIPAIVEGKYTLGATLYSPAAYLSNFRTAIDLVVYKWSFGALVLVDLVSIGCFLFEIFLMSRNKHHADVLEMTGIIGAMFAIFFFLPISGFFVHIFKPLAYFQFPWRFYSLLVISTPFLVASIYSRLPRKLFAVLLLLFFTYSATLWRVKGFLPDLYADTLLTSNTETTTETGETSPKWSTQFQQGWPKEELEIVWGGQMTYETVRHEYQTHVYDVVAQQPSQLVDNTLYFPGWTVLIDGKETEINFQDQNWRGLITFPIAEGKHRIEIVFRQTKMRKLAVAVSIISFGIITIGTVVDHFKKYV